MVALHGQDRARLRQIEARLAQDDPEFVTRLRRWRPSTENGSVPPDEFSVVRPWMLVVFLVGFTAWVFGPALGVLTALVGARWARRRDQSTVGDTTRGRAPRSGTGT